MFNLGYATPIGTVTETIVARIRIVLMKYDKTKNIRKKKYECTKLQHR